MLKPHFVAGVFLVGAMVLGTGLVSGQNYPTKPVRILAIGPGGGSDFPARLIAPGLAASLGQNVIVDNRAGVIPAQIVSKALPDGYTLLSAGSSFWIGPLLQNSPYDPVKDFATVSLLNQAPNILVVHPSLPVNSVKELIAYAKAKPGELNCGTNPTGGSPHLAYELFKSMAGVNIVRVPYGASAQALVALIGGQLHLMFPSAGGMAQYIKSGRLKALAIASAKPSALLPELPTIAASGLPGYESVSYNGVFAPAKTPDAVIKRLSQEIGRIIDGPDVKDKFLATGVEPLSSTPEQFEKIVKSEMTRLGKVIKDAGVRAD
jgi:tripartite-type tricarboxylate transporter receptor subunit TctC